MSLQYGWENGKADLKIDSSRAAATAYKIASHPASEPESSETPRNSHSMNGAHSAQVSGKELSTEGASSTAGGFSS